MKALRLSSDQDEKRELKAQFTAIVDAADRIKSTKTWSPLVEPQPALHMPSTSRSHGKPSAASPVSSTTFTTNPSTGKMPVSTTLNTDAPGDLSQNKESPKTSLSISDYSRMQTLPEPVSTRKRSRKEEIVLLKASIVDGFKCPPWDKPPISTEFTLGNATGPYV